MKKIITNSDIEAIKLNGLCQNHYFISENFTSEIILPISQDMYNDYIASYDMYSYTSKSDTDYNTKHTWLWDGKILAEGDSDEAEEVPIKEFLEHRGEQLSRSLYVLGILQPSVVNKTTYLSKEHIWYLVDYSVSDYKIGTLFEFEDNFAILEEVQLQFNNKGYVFEQIDTGYKTLCRFKFNKPVELNRMNTWKYNKEGIRMYKVKN